MRSQPGVASSNLTGPIFPMQTNIKTFLEKNNINYTLYTHQAVFSCEESEIHCKHVPGIAGKNLFLKEGEQYFLVILPCKKKAKHEGSCTSSPSQEAQLCK